MSRPQPPPLPGAPPARRRVRKKVVVVDGLPRRGVGRARQEAPGGMASADDDVEEDGAKRKPETEERKPLVFPDRARRQCEEECADREQRKKVRGLGHLPEEEGLP